MERKKWRELKISILEHIQKSEGGLTSQNISNLLDCTMQNASMCLLNMARQGLLRRERDFPKVWKKPKYLYNITNRGLARLEYYRKMGLTSGIGAP